MCRKKPPAVPERVPLRSNRAGSSTAWPTLRYRPDLFAVHSRIAGLGKGGEVTMPLAKTFFSPKFGMVRDKFGVNWMVMVDA